MWTRDERCREIVEGAWDPGQIDLEDGIIGRLKRCQEQLQSWNWAEFGNVNKMLKKKKKKRERERNFNNWSYGTAYMGKQRRLKG